MEDKEMPSAHYPLEEGGSDRLEITWETSWPGRWKNIVVRLDGQQICTVADRKDMEAGQTLFLPGGSTLGVQLLKAPFSTGLRVVLDGRVLPGSAGEMTEPERLARNFGTAAWVPFVYGMLNVVLGLLSAFTYSYFVAYILASYGISPVSIVFGLALVGLAFVIRRRVMWGVVAVAALLVIEGVVGGYLVAQHAYSYYRDTTLVIAGTATSVTARILMLNVVPLVVMLRGMSVLRRLKRQQPSAI
jgi:hypothetical protein